MNITEIINDDLSTKKTLTSITFVLAIVLIIFGSLANSFCYYICCKERLAKIHVFVFYKYLLITNFLALYFSNIYITMFNYDSPSFIESNVFICAFYTLFQFLSFQWLSWQIVSFIIDSNLELSSIRFKLNKSCIEA